MSDNTSHFRSRLDADEPSIVIPRAKPEVSLKRFLVPLMSAEGNERFKNGVIFARDEALLHGARYAVANYLRQATGYADLNSHATSLLGRTAEALKGNLSPEDLATLRGQVASSLFLHEANRRAAELTGTALKSPLFMDDILVAATALEITLAPGANRTEVRERLRSQLATDMVENASLPEAETDTTR